MGGREPGGVADFGGERAEGGVDDALGDDVDGDQIEAGVGPREHDAHAARADADGEQRERRRAVDPAGERPAVARRDDARPRQDQRHGAAPARQKMLGQRLRQRVGVRVPALGEQCRLRLGRVIATGADGVIEPVRIPRQRREVLLHRRPGAGVRRHVRRRDIHQRV